MHMTARHLKHSPDLNIEKLEIVSMEGRYYLARFQCDGETYLLTDDKDEPLLFGGAAAARDYFRNHNPRAIEVIPPTGTDEMIGQPDDDSDEDSMRVPL